MSQSDGVLVDQGLELLTETQCRELIAGEQIGRVAVSIGALPAIFPVNYRVVDGDIVFRTGDGLKRRAALRGSVVGFEVDHIEPERSWGWSVMVVGVAEEQRAGEDDELLDAISPWAGGERTHLIRIRPEVVTGRRIGTIQDPAAASNLRRTL